jgi:ankyrin repeat protein
LSVGSLVLAAMLCITGCAGNATAAGQFDDFFIDVRNDRASNVQSALQRGLSPNTLNDGSPAIMEAIKEDAWKVYDVLLAAKGIDLNIKNPAKETPLMYLAIKGDVPRATELVKRGAEVNQEGWTALHYAATVGNLDLIKLFIANYAYIDAAAPNKTTPLMMAARGDHGDAVKLLVDEGADTTLKNDLGMDAAEFARSMGHTGLADVLRKRIDQDIKRRGGK